MLLVGAFDGYGVDVEIAGDRVKHFVVHVLSPLAELGYVRPVDAVRLAGEADALSEFVVTDPPTNEVALFGFLGAEHEGLEGLSYAYIFRVVLCVGLPATQLYCAHAVTLSIQKYPCQPRRSIQKYPALKPAPLLGTRGAVRKYLRYPFNRVIPGFRLIRYSGHPLRILKNFCESLVIAS